MILSVMSFSMTMHLTNGNKENSIIDESGLSPSLEVKKKTGQLTCPTHHSETLRDLFQSHEIVAWLFNSDKSSVFARICLLQVMISVTILIDFSGKLSSVYVEDCAAQNWLYMVVVLKN